MENKITLDKLVRWGGIALLVVSVLFAVNYLSSVLLPFFIAWFFAYLLYPVVKFVQYRLRVRVRAIAIIITLLLTIALICGVVWLIIPPMIEQFDAVGKAIGRYVTTDQGETVMGYIQKFVDDNQYEIEKFFHSKDFFETVKSTLPNLFSFVGQTANVLISIIGSFITLLYMFFILM